MYEFEPETPRRSQTKAARALGEKLANKHRAIAPVDIERIINSEGYEIIHESFPENISGYVDLVEREIYVNIKKPRVHRRFTLAHELGHLVLNHKRRKWTEFADLHESSPDKPLEEEANAFASGILMPSYLVKQLFKEQKPNEIAERLQVSETALWIALQTYGLI